MEAQKAKLLGVKNEVIERDLVYQVTKEKIREVKLRTDAQTADFLAEKQQFLYSMNSIKNRSDELESAQIKKRRQLQQMREQARQLREEIDDVKDNLFHVTSQISRDKQQLDTKKKNIQLQREKIQRKSQIQLFCS
mmetsp:Transcript_16593/g.28250  ORF Transcript_16593/g.28250 Transcript_16593/m.28250 type:complete len:136 (-) Transcript_16593:378-785(-)